MENICFSLKFQHISFDIRTDFKFHIALFFLLIYWRTPYTFPLPDDLTKTCRFFIFNFCGRIYNNITDEEETITILSSQMEIDENNMKK